jgi:hypothetical protein
MTDKKMDKEMKKNTDQQDGVSDSNVSDSNVSDSKKVNSNVETTPPLPVQTNDDPRGHVGAQDQQVDHTLTPPAPEESVEKVSN